MRLPNISRSRNITGLVCLAAISHLVKLDYIEANLDAPIGLPEIVAACGVPGRTLIKRFRDFRGTSPMRYLRTARYSKIREELSPAEPEESVAEIAASWGFSQYGPVFGRLSQTFRRKPLCGRQRGRNAPTKRAKSQRPEHVRIATNELDFRR